MADIQHLNEVIADNHALQGAYEKLIQGKTDRMFLRFSPYSGKVAANLALKGLLKVHPNKKKALRILECLTCDSHRDIAGNVFATYLKK